MQIRSNNETHYIADKHFAIDCPNCNGHSSISVVSIPRFEFVMRYKPKRIGIVYKCDLCNEPITLIFGPLEYPSNSNGPIGIPTEGYEIRERALEDFDYEYLPTQVADSFREAARVLSVNCYNAFAAMCRRTLQVAAMEVGADGKDKIKKQISELKDMIEISAEIEEALDISMKTGHDGAHPHLPEVDEPRAEVLMSIMKDILDQLFVRKAKIEEAKKLRKKKIDEKQKEKEAQ